MSSHKFQLVQLIAEAKFSNTNGMKGLKLLSPEKTKVIVSACSRQDIFEKIMDKLPDFPCLELQEDLEDMKQYIGKIHKSSSSYKIKDIRYKLLITKTSCKKTLKASKKIECTRKNRETASFGKNIKKFFGF